MLRFEFAKENLSNQYPQMYQNTKVYVKEISLKLGTKNHYLDFIACNYGKPLSCLKPAPLNFSKCKVSTKIKKL